MKTVRGITKLISALVLAGSVTLIGANVPFASAGSSAAAFDENNIVLSFGAISDTHVGPEDSGAYATQFKTALTQLKARSNNNLDALLVAGDCSNDANDDSLKNFQTIAYGNLPSNTRLFAIGGNHDGADGDSQLLNKLMGDTELKNAVPTCTAADLAQGDYHTVIKGYHFIGMSMKGMVGDTDAYDLAWLKTQLAAAKADDPNKAIFVTIHGPCYDTIYGSHMDDNYETTAGPGSRWNDTTIIPVLKDYPQVVVFSGHSHYPLNPETSIMQKDFTQVGTASVAFMSNDPYYIDTQGSTDGADSGKVSQGNLVQVDKNGVIRITRCDFSQNKTIRQPWTFPTATDSSQFIYTKDRGAKFDPPQFPDGANITAKFVPSDTSDRVTVRMTFTNAVSKQDIVQYYKVDVTSPDGSTVYYTNYCHSDFYLHPDGKLADTLSEHWVIKKGLDDANLESLPKDKDFVISITPFDSFGNKGNAISATFNLSAPVTTTSTSITATDTSATETSGSAVTTTTDTSNTAAPTQLTTAAPSVPADIQTTGTASGNTESPKTGDSSMTAVLLLAAVLAASAVSGGILTKKAAKRKG